MLEVKGDFCSQVRRILAGANREADYLEVGLNTGVCYNPLHNDLDPYAVALCDRQSPEQPVRQVEGAVLAAGLHGSAEVRDLPAPHYGRLHHASEVYRYIIEDGLIDKNIRTLEAQFRDPPPVLVIDAQRLQGEVNRP